MLATLLVTGTTVTTPRPSRVAVALARSLLTTTAGRALFASLPRPAPTTTCHISPRSITEPITGDVLPRIHFACIRPFRPGIAVVVLQRGVSQHANSALNTSRA